MDDERDVRTRLIIDAHRSGRFNMAADDYATRSLVDFKEDAFVRFYQWNPPAVSLGCHQKPEIIDYDTCRELGWDVVYRSSGGRALLHLEDLSYVVIVPSGGNSYSRLRRLYEDIAVVVSTSLNTLGVKTETTAFKNRKLQPVQRVRSGLCLDTSVRGEVTVSGRKIAAAAQHIYRNSLMQHGSIQLNGDPTAIVDVIKIEPEKRETVRNLVMERACSLEEIKNDIINVKALVEALRDNFADIMKLDMQENFWTDAEIQLIEASCSAFDILNSHSSH